MSLGIVTEKWTGYSFSKSSVVRVWALLLSSISKSLLQPSIDEAVLQLFHYFVYLYILKYVSFTIFTQSLAMIPTS